MPGTQLQPKIIVGSLTLVTRKIISQHIDSVLLGISAREMPFIISDNTSIINDLSSSSNSIVG